MAGSWFFPAREATAQQLAVTGAHGGYGYDPVDGDRGFRPVGGGAREVPAWTLEKARTYSVAAYRSNPMARAVIDTYCVDEATEILTAAGWRRFDQVAAGDEVLTLDHETGMSEWQPVLSMHVFPAVERELVRIRTRDHSSLSTGTHRWPVVSQRRVWADGAWRGRETSRVWRTSDTLSAGDNLVRAAASADAPVDPKWSDDFVELVAWAYTEGHIRGCTGITLTQSETANPQHVARIDAVLRRLFGAPATSLRESGACWKRTSDSGNARFILTAAASAAVHDVAPNRVPDLLWLRELTPAQLRMFVDVSVLADGWTQPNGGRHFGQKSRERAESLQFAATLAGIASTFVVRQLSGEPHYVVNLHLGDATDPVRAAQASASSTIERVAHDGIVWCPRTANMTWLARRDGTVYFTGNTSFCVGDSGVNLQCSSPEVRVFAERFWSDPRNAIAARQDAMLRDHLLMGETALEMLVGPTTGLVRFSPIDPGRIIGVGLDRGNPLWPSTLEIRNPGGEPYELAVVQLDDIAELRTGEVMFWASFKALLTDRRGTPFLSPIIDWLDSYDTVLQNLIDRTALARYMVWDVTLDGADKDAIDEFIEKRGGLHAPRSGTTEVHNEKVTWDAKSVQTGSFEDTNTSKAVMTNIAGGAGLAKTWLAEPEDANRATSLTMAEPVRRRVAGVQKVWLDYDAELVRFAVDQAVAAKRLDPTVKVPNVAGGREIEMPASMTVSVTGPEVAAADAQITAEVLVNLSTALDTMQSKGLLTAEAAQIAAQKAWEDYMGVPYSPELGKPGADRDDVATHVESTGGKPSGLHAV